MSERATRSVAVVLPGLLLAMFLGAIDLTIMAPALPAVAQDLGGLDQIPVVVTGYLLAATAMMPIYGKLGDRFGRMPVMLASIGLFVAGAALCIFATSMTQLAAFRAVQGLGGGGLSIGAQAIIGEIISPRERGRYLGYIGAAYVVAAVGGPLLGGFLIDHVGWRGVFVIYLPLGIAAAVIMWFTLRLPRPSDRLPVDYAGALSLAATVVGIVLLGQTRNLIFAGLAVVGLSAWLVSARSAADPILPLRLFRDRKFAIPVSVSFLIGFALFGVITYLPTFLQVVSGLTAVRAGLVLTALMAGVLVGTVGSGRLITRSGRYKIFPLVGTAIAAIGLALLALLLLNSDQPLAIAGVMIIVGLGIGLVMQVMVLAAQNGAAYADLGVATSSVTFLRQIGASLGVAIVGAVLLSAGALEPAAAAQTLAARMPLVIGLMAPLVGLAFLLLLALPVIPLRETAYVTEEAR
jgi:EmrB/QacA subfamily drug resistance transporter